MSFKAQVDADLHGVFLNDDEFADVYDVRYDKVLYKDVTLVRRTDREEPRRGTGTMYVHDYSRGLFNKRDIVHVAKKDIGGNVPEVDLTFELSKGDGFYQRYYVRQSLDAMGMVRLVLEVADE